MEIFVYSDESGVFDRKNDEPFVFGGIVFLGSEAMQNCLRRYRSVEDAVRNANDFDRQKELKACDLSVKDRSRLVRVTNQEYRFGVVIDKEKINQNIFREKKSKQRYLDYAYKIALKRLFQKRIAEKALDASQVIVLHVYADQHSTATNGKYELCQSLDQEFRIGTFNPTWQKFYPPIFENLKSVKVTFCNSCDSGLIRAADLYANLIYRKAKEGTRLFPKTENAHIIQLPTEA